MGRDGPPMSRPATGGVRVRKTTRGESFEIRFTAYGQGRYQHLGTSAGGWTRERAELALQDVLADVRRGIWQPPKPADPAPEPSKDPGFHEFASEWFEANQAGWRPRTRIDYQWQLSNHLLPFFRGHTLSQITVREVDRYRSAKVREGTLKGVSINKTITRLAQILEVAVEYGLIDRNPAKGKRRRVKASKPAPVWLDRAEHITALLDAASELDRGARDDRRHVHRRAMLAVLVFAGLRISELIALRWRDVDLSGGRIAVGESKTDAGVRTVDILPVLRDELATLKASIDPSGDMLVFPASSGGPLNPSNIRNRVMAPAQALANERLEAAGEVPLPRLTPHKLRHTFASILVALGTDVGATCDQLGHTTPDFTFTVYRHAMRRDPASRCALRHLVGLDGVSGRNLDWTAPDSHGNPVAVDLRGG